MGIHTPDSAVENVRFDNEHMSFVNVLSYLATLVDTPVSNPIVELVAEVCCFSEVAGARKSKNHSEVTIALRIVEQVRSREGRRRKLEWLDSGRQARSSSVSSSGPRKDETSASSRLLEISASSERTVRVALMSL
eukprot:TRINITY_DN4476_c0_g3_i2.p1 TRINITY_DN4476_c0_g3~~TRINITY_DN4476_c0_g3_i2.p1  ORF type:complete len:135 (-),score=11.39 TRINITY_DN4476_c0_g3_i2:224-628(-)